MKNCYFPHESSARNNPQLIRIRMKFGWEGYGIFWALIEMMRESEDYSLDWSDENVEAIAYHLQYDKDALALLVQCCSIAGVLRLHNQRLISDGLIERMEPLDKRRVLARDKANKRWHPNNTEQLHAGALPGQCNGNATAMQLDKIRIDKNIGKEINNPLPPTAPEKAKHLLNSVGVFVSTDNFKNGNGRIIQNILEVLPPPESTPPRGAQESLEEFSRRELHDPSENPSWIHSNGFMLQGRRPMKRYPRIWMSEVELKNLFEMLEAKVPRSHWKDLFRSVDAYIGSKIVSGKTSVDTMPTYGWMTSWALTDLLRALNEELKVKRNQQG